MARLGYGLEAGTTIGTYRIDAPIGRGGMGVVYEATHLRLNRKVALKLLSPELSADPAFHERFIRESELAASIDHPNIIPVYDADEQDGLLYLAMRHVEGADLDEVLYRRGRLSPEEALAVLAPAASALDAAHERGLVHRDVKPGNILIEEQSNRVYLTDFGLAKLITASGPTLPGSFLGTLHYCAPEQIEGKPVDARTDVYALGCVLYHCLTGQPPYVRDSEFALMHAHLHAPPPAVTAARPELPRLLDDVIATAMAKDPAVRYGSAGAFVAGLREAATGEASTTASAESPRVELDLPPATLLASPPAAPVPDERPPESRLGLVGRRGSRLLLLGGFALAAALGTYLAFAGSSPPRNPPPAIQADLEVTNEIHNVSLARYLTENERSTRSYEDDELDAAGYVVILSLRTLGLAGETLRVRWTLYSGSSERPVVIEPAAAASPASQTELRARDFRDQTVASVRPRAATYRVIPKLWLPYPQRSLRAFARVEVVLGADVLAFTDTNPFEVPSTAQAPPASPPASPPPPPPTVTFFPGPPPAPQAPPPTGAPRLPPPAIPAVVEVAPPGS